MSDWTGLTVSDCILLEFRFLFRPQFQELFFLFIFVVLLLVLIYVQLYVNVYSCVIHECPLSLTMNLIEDFVIKIEKK